MSEPKRTRDILQRLFKDKKAVPVRPHKRSKGPALDAPGNGEGPSNDSTAALESDSQNAREDAADHSSTLAVQQSSVDPVSSPQGPIMPITGHETTTSGDLSLESTEIALGSSTVVADQSSRPRDMAALWEKAYAQFKSKNPKLAAILEHEWSSPVEGDSDSSTIDFTPGNFREMINRQLAQRDAKQLQFKFYSEKIVVREQFEKVVKFISCSKDIVADALSTQPYAALGWSGVCLILPLMLNCSDQHELMIGGLARITDLVDLYRLEERVYLDDSKADTSWERELSWYMNSIVELYSQILEYQAQVIHHLSKKVPLRFKDGVLKTLDWKNWIDAINDRDEHCKRSSTVLDKLKQDQYRQALLDALTGLDRNDTEAKMMENLCSTSNYEQEKEVNPDRVQGTCQWFLDSPTFQTWRDHLESSMMLFSAGPGSGKSVMSRALINEGLLLPQSHVGKTRVFYFFFKDGRMNPANAIGAILHQIFVQLPSLKLFALEDFKNYGKRLNDRFHVLWKILLKVSERYEAGRIVCVIDALDECEPVTRKALIQSLVHFYKCASERSSRGTLKMFITSRLQDDIDPGFFDLRDCSNFTRIDGSKSSDDVAGDINRVIDTRVQELFGAFSEADRVTIREQLRDMQNRTYLLLKLILEIIGKSLSKHSIKNKVEDLLKNLPRTTPDAYIRLLGRVQDRELATAIFKIVVAARRPIKVDEMNILLSVYANGKYRLYNSSEPLWANSKEIISLRIENICGMFVQIYNEKVYFIHQTAREFLIHGVPNSVSDWQGCISQAKAHEHICRLALAYRTAFWADRDRNSKMFDFGVSRYFAWYTREHFIAMTAIPGYDMTLASRICRELTRTKQWRHMSYAESESEDLIYEVMPEFQEDFELASEAAAFAIHMRRIEISKCIMEEFRTHVGIHYIASRALLEAAECVHRDSGDEVQRLLRASTDVNANTGEDKTSLAIAMSFENLNLIHMLLEAGVNANCDEGRVLLLASSRSLRELRLVIDDLMDDALTTPSPRFGIQSMPYLANVFPKLVERLWKVVNQEDKDAAIIGFATYRAKSEIVKALIQHGANINVCDEHGYTELHHAAALGWTMDVKFLIECGADTSLTDSEGQNALHYAVHLGHLETAKLLIRKIRLELADSAGLNALHHACLRPQNEILDFLIGKGANVNATDRSGRTPLHYAARDGDETIVSTLIGSGANLKAQDEDGQTPFHQASVQKDNINVHLLLMNEETDVDLLGRDGKAVLHRAAQHANTALITYMLKLGADLNNQDREGRTALHYAVKFDVQKLLHSSGADVNIPDRRGQTSLHCAAGQGDIALLSYLVNKNANLNMQDGDGQTKLQYATRTRETDSQTLPVNKSADVDIPDADGKTLLHYVATLNGADLALLRKIIRMSVNLNAKDNRSRTPLHIASKHNNVLLVESLLDEGADLEATDDFVGWTALHIASSEGNRDMVEFLTRKKANLNATCKDGFNAMDYAAQEKHIDVIQFFRDCDLKISTSYSAKHPYAIHIAADFGDESLMKFWIDHDRSNVDIRNTLGQSPIHRAAYHGCITVLQLLRDEGAVLDSRDNEGLTPLDYAICNMQVESVKQLVKWEVDLNAKDAKRRGPLHWLYVFGGRNRWTEEQLEILSILENNEATWNLEDATNLKKLVFRDRFIPKDLKSVFNNEDSAASKIWLTK